MFVIPNAVMSQFDSVLKSREIPIAQYADYKKWLRFFQDFSTKYPVPDSKLFLKINTVIDHGA